MKLCTIDGCQKPLRARGMCTAHWSRWRRYGDPHHVTTPADRVRPMQDRFWEKVNKSGPVPAHLPELGPCWLWTGAISDTGYGNFTIGTNKTAITHRLAYEWIIGPIPDGLVLDHLCKTRPCCNPSHLEPVPPRENSRRGKEIGHDHPSAPQTCKRGHDWSVNPPRLARRADGRVTRQCRVCIDERRQRASERISAEIAARAATHA